MADQLYRVDPNANLSGDMTLEAFQSKLVPVNHQPYPKIVYLHPIDKTQEHSFVVVNNEEEHQAKLDCGYRDEPHVPANLAAVEFESKPCDGSGTERYGDGDPYGMSVMTDQSAHATEAPADQEVA